MVHEAGRVNQVVHVANEIAQRTYVNGQLSSIPATLTLAGYNSALAVYDCWAEQWVVCNEAETKKNMHGMNATTYVSVCDVPLQANGQNVYNTLKSTQAAQFWVQHQVNTFENGDESKTMHENSAVELHSICAVCGNKANLSDLVAFEVIDTVIQWG